MANEDPRSQRPVIGSTFAFRVINPELFIKPNKVMMGLGLVCFGGCILYLMNMNKNTKKSQAALSLQAGRPGSNSKWE